MKKNFIFYLIFLGIISVSHAQTDWEILFDGTDLSQWKGYLKEDISSEWTVDNGILTFTPKPGREHGGSNIITKKTYHNFELSLEWNVSSGGNSGIFWAIQEDSKYAEPYQTGPEIQILDNDKHPDGKILTHRAGSLYDMIQALPESANPAGEWNICVVKLNYDKNEASVHLNGVKVVEFQPKGESWEQMIKASKFADWAGFAKSDTGHIGLQDHSDIVHFKNIKIRNLD